MFLWLGRQVVSMKPYLFAKPTSRGEALRWLTGGLLIGASFTLITWVIVVPVARWLVERVP